MYKKVRKFGVVEAAYLAGLVDGEGTITLTHKQKGAKRHIVLSISSTERKILEYVLKVVGAGQITSKITYKNQHKPSFAYQISNRQALNVLSQISKYLKTYKSRRASFVLKHYVNVTPRNGKYTKKLVKKRVLFEDKFFEILPK